MTTTTISPFVVSGIDKVELADGKGGKKFYWKKEILPSGTRKYKGKELDFSKINPAVLSAFNDKAVDAVPFVLSLADNKHPETGQEIDNLEGDLHQLELSGEGSLFGYFDLTPDVVKKIEASNKKLGVSARIDVDYEREDVGKKYPYALRHVCATTAAHIKGMKPWETVELSEDEKGNETLDLSTEVIELANDKETGDDLVAVEIPKEKLDKLFAFLSDMEKADDLVKKLSDNGDKKDDKSIELSEEANKRIELAEDRAKKAFEFAERTMEKAAEKEWATTKKELAAAGVPPVMLTIAEPVMKLHKRPSIDLSEGGTLDSGEIIAKILDAAKGTIQLNEESGHSVRSNGELDNDKDFLDFMNSFVPQDSK